MPQRLAVELRTNRLSQAEARDAARHRFAIRPVGCHRVVGICDSDDPGHQRDLISDQPVGIPHAVDTLMVMADDPCDVFVVFNPCEDALPDNGVLFHDAPLCASQRPRLLEQAWREADLSDVMHETREVCQLLLFIRQPQMVSNIAGIHGNCR